MECHAQEASQTTSLPLSSSWLELSYMATHKGARGAAGLRWRRRTSASADSGCGQLVEEQEALRVTSLAVCCPLPDSDPGL